MELSVQHLMEYTLALEYVAQLLGFLNAYSAHKHGLSLGVAVYNILNYSGKLAADLGINLVVLVLSLRRLVGRNGNDVQRVNALKFLLLGFCSTRHTAELGVHSEEILESYSRKRLILAANYNVLLCLYRLMQSLVVAPAYHNTTGKLVYNENLAVADDVILIAFHHIVRL